MSFLTESNRHIGQPYSL